MKKEFNFYSLLDSLNKGYLIRDIMAILFKLVGIFVFIGVSYLFFATGRHVRDIWILLLLFFVWFASYFIAKLWFYHAKAIIDFEDPDYSVIPIVSQFFRAIGETYALFATAVSIGGMLMIWFSDYWYAMGVFTRYIFLFPSLEIDNKFISGFLFLLGALLIAYVILLVAYFIAENVLVFADIAKNTKRLGTEK